MEPQSDHSQKFVAASRAYFSRWAKSARRKFVLDEEMIDKIRAIRQEIRVEEGGGGMCHLVSEWLQSKYGLDRCAVTYLDPEGEVIFTGHVVNVLSDGSLLDSTADQIGEGNDVHLIGLDDPAIGRYRPEFDIDYYPGHPDIDSDLDCWLGLWDGRWDTTAQDENRKERGQGWHVEDTSLLEAYLREQLDLAGGRDSWYGRLMQHWLDDIASRHPDSNVSVPNL